VQRRAIRRRAVVRHVATTTQTAVVTEQIPPIPPVPPQPAPVAVAVAPQPAPAAVAVTPSIAVAATVVEPFVEETWYYTNVDCCYVYFGQQWLWDTDLWYYHHFRGHYYERSPQYWTRYGFNEPYWRRYEQGRRFDTAERRWIREGQAYASAGRARASVQPQLASYDMGRHDMGRHLGWAQQRGWERHGGWAQQRGWERHGGWERHAGLGGGGHGGHGHGGGHGKK